MTAHGRTRLKLWLGIVGVFIFGCVTGASLDGLYRLRASSEPQEMRGARSKQAIFDSMKRDLNLNDEQSIQIRGILDQTRNDYRALRGEVRPRYDAVRQNARSRIRALLTAEQQQRFDIKVAERDAQRAQDNRAEDNKDKH